MIFIKNNKENVYFKVPTKSLNKEQNNHDQIGIVIIIHKKDFLQMTDPIPLPSSIHA
jgi:hypothetical protein